MNQPAPAGTSRSLYLTALLSLAAVQALSTMAFNTGAVLAPAAAPVMGATKDDVAYFVAVVYAVSIVAVISAGAITRRLGPIRFTQIALLVSAAGVALLSVGHIAAAIAAAMLIGLGGGPVTVASSQILARVTPARLSNVTFSIKQSGVPLGFALSGAALPSIVEAAGWRHAALTIALLAAAMAIAIHPLRRLYDDERAVAGRIFPSIATIIEPLAMCWRDPPLRLLCLVGMAYSATQATVTNFIVNYGMDHLRLDYVAAGALLSAASLAGIVGRIGWGALADALRRPLAVLAALGAIMATFGVALALAQPDWPRWLVYGIAVVLGGTAVGWNGVYISECARRAPPGRAGEFVGATSFFVFLGPVLWPMLFRQLLYFTQSYPLGYALMAACAGLCALAILRRIRCDDP
ncbi:MAG: MFS transporter [Alphaproteobacteria bacterium]|nr:MFS transporter [Alphaproteobacteria bacterium]MCW5742278.1 MFS transporter [Alphaproteobacteria bacterium]